MGHDIGGYATSGVTLGAPSAGTTNNMKSTLSSPTPGPVGNRDIPHDDFYSLKSASARALERTHGSSSHANDGNAFGAPVAGNTTPMGNSLSASTPRSRDNHDLYHRDGVYGTRYSSVNPNPSNNALPVDIGTAYGSNSNVSNRTAFGVPSTNAANTVSGTMLGSTSGPVGNRYLQHSDRVYPTGHSTAIPNLSINALPNHTGKALGSNSDAINDATIGTARDSNSNTAVKDNALAAQLPGNPSILRSNFSPSAPGPLNGPDGRRRWLCTTCGKTFSRPSHMARHEKKHSMQFPYPYQCLAPGCKYPGTYSEDKLAKHRLQAGH